ncbi:MAG: hypothetical protein WBA91_13750 [Paracoccaceae bacterium]
MRTLTLALGFCVLLAACVAEEPRVAGTSGVEALLTDPRFETVKPGPNAVEALDALMIFDRVCVETHPSLARAEKAVRAMPFQQNPASGTYYHRTLDLSIKLVKENKGACSMVFVSTEKERLGITLLFAAAVSTTGSVGVDVEADAATSTGPGNSEFVIFPVGKKGNRTYFHAVLSPAN